MNLTITPSVAGTHFVPIGPVPQPQKKKPPSWIAAALNLGAVAQRATFWDGLFESRLPATRHLFAIASSGTASTQASSPWNAPVCIYQPSGYAVQSTSAVRGTLEFTVPGKQGPRSRRVSRIRGTLSGLQARGMGGKPHFARCNRPSGHVGQLGKARAA